MIDAAGLLPPVQGLWDGNYRIPGGANDSGSAIQTMLFQ